MSAYRVFMTTLIVAIIAGSANVSAQQRNIVAESSVATACIEDSRGACIAAKVRPVKIELQMHSIGSKVAWCKNDCLGTLRKNSVEFWSGQRDKF